MKVKTTEEILADMRKEISMDPRLRSCKMCVWANEASLDAVRFLDYDGTVLYSYSMDDFVVLTEFPELPTQEGLTCQGWNWEIGAAQSYVVKYGKLDIGATYITDDGKTRLYITITAEGRMAVPLYISQTVANGVTIDWGDGSDTETISGTGNRNTTHTYTSIGDYVITLDVADGCTLGFGAGSDSYCVLGSTFLKVYPNMLQRVEVGAGVTSIGRSAFNSCNSLASIVIPDGVTSIGVSAFSSCYSLASIVIPDGVTSIGGSAFNSCYSLASIVIPDGVTSIGGSAFNSCYSMAFYDFSSHASVPTLSNTYAFNNIPSDCKIIVPDALYDEWIAATNWSTYASYIITKTDWDASQS